MKKNTLKRIIILLKKQLPLLIISLLLALLSVITSLLVPYLFGITIDYIVGASNVNYQAIYQNLLTIIVLIFLTGIFQWLMSVINNKITYELIKDLRNQAFHKFAELPLSFIDKNPSGKIVNTIIVDTEQFGDGLLMTLSQLFTGIITIIGVIIVMLFINIWVSLLVILLTPLSLFVAKVIAKNSYSSFKQQSDERGKQTALIDEMISNQKVVKTYNYEEKALTRFTDENEELAKISLKAIFISSLVNPSTRFINAVIYAGVAFIGGILAASNTSFAITVGELTCLLGYANQYTKPFNEITGVIAELQNAFACIEKVFALIDEKSEIEPQNALTIDQPNYQIAIENLYFAYQKDIPLIQNFNLTVNEGEKIAIVGPTGCGKTTIINLLMRFYDADQGMIRIDGKNIYEYSRKSMRQQYGMVLQDTWIKNGSINDNIKLGKENATQEEIIEASKKAKIYHFISQLPNGFDTIIAEDDNILSTGQKQLICIARVMLAKPNILLLDEATSNIDTRTEKIIQEAFDELMKDKTSFIVAHRLSTIKNANKIIVMDKGQIIEIGTHNELLQKKGFYYSLYNSQFQHN